MLWEVVAVNAAQLAVGAVVFYMALDRRLTRLETLVKLLVEGRVRPRGDDPCQP